MQIENRRDFEFLLHCASLIALVFLCLLTSTASFAETPKPELSWIEEDGTDIPIDWRTSSAWIWNHDQFALQLWIEIPQELGETLRQVSNSNTELQIVSGSALAPFTPADHHVFLLIHMRSPSELIEVKSPNLAEGTQAQVRALKIEIPFSKTTWMRNSNCRRFRPFLVEKNRRGQPPFFLALDCNQVPGTVEPSIEIQGSKEVSLSLIPAGRSETKPETNSLRVPFGKTPDQLLQQIAKIEVKNLQGDSRSVFDLRRVTSVSSTAQEEDNEDTKPQDLSSPPNHWKAGVAGMFLEADNRGDSPSLSSGLQPGVSVFWRQEISNSLSVVRVGTLLPFTLLTFNSTKIESPQLAWIRALAEPKRAQKGHVQGVFGVQGFRLGMSDEQYGSPMWLSPTVGAKITNEKYKISWEALLSPLAFGSGSNGLGRVQISLRTEIEARKFETFSVDFFAEAVALRTLGYDSNGWFANGLNAGLLGEF